MFWEGKKSVFYLLLKFGEMCIITFHDNSHNIESTNQGIAGLQMDIQLAPSVFLTQNNNNLTQDVTLLGKSHGEWDKVEVWDFIPVSNDGSEEEGFQP